mgnify:CR=1 FL=1
MLLALAGEFVPDAVNVSGGPVGEEVAPWLELVRKLGLLAGTLSPEARIARAAFESTRGDIPGVLRECASGRELVERGFSLDVDLAADLDASDAAPMLVGGAYTLAAT